MLIVYDMHSDYFSFIFRFLVIRVITLSTKCVLLPLRILSGMPNQGIISLTKTLATVSTSGCAQGNIPTHFV